MNKRFGELSKYILKRGRGARSFKSSVKISFLRLRLAWKGVLSWVAQQRFVERRIICDVLVIHPSRKSYLNGRKAPLIEEMKLCGLSVEEYVEEDDAGLIMNRSFAAPRQKVPLHLRWYAAHAEYLVCKYDAKVILTERNGWVVPSFLKYMEKGRHKVVHLAHSVPSGESSRYGYFDYDHYLIFGQSSYDYLSSITSGYGSCSTHFAGPYFFSDWAVLKKKNKEAKMDQHRLLFLGGGPAYEATREYLESCAWLINWMENNPDARLDVKVHPRGAGKPWIVAAEKNPRINMLPLNASLEECAGDFDLVLSGYTNAIVDVARFGIPFILLGSGADYFSTQSFDIRWVRSSEELACGVNGVLKNSEQYMSNVNEFYNYHVHERMRPRGATLDIIKDVVEGKAPSGRLLGCDCSPHSIKGRER